jgi:uncharacterized protein YndB with AHSA1/START domain
MASDTFTVERSATIEASPERIYEQLANFHNWTNWSPWEEVDPALRRTYSGPDARVGAAYRWSGNRKAGTGRMEITEVDEPTRVQLDLFFEKPFKAHNLTVFSITPEGSGSRVTWTMTGPTTLMTKLMGLFSSMDKMIGPDFEKGLTKLKATTETPKTA